MPIDVRELVNEVVDRLKTDREIPEGAKLVICDELFAGNIANLTLDDIPLLVAMMNKDSVVRVQMMMTLAFEVGRLYGRSELVREMEEGKR